MKLRFRKNSIRVRVNRREVEMLAAGSPLEERILFPGNSFISYVVDPSALLNPVASFREGVIRISPSTNDIRRWASSDEIGIYFQLPVDGAELRVAIEKDLECVDASPEEHDPDAFPRTSGKSC